MSRRPTYVRRATYRPALPHQTRLGTVSSRQPLTRRGHTTTSLTALALVVVASTAAAAIKTSAPLAPTHHTENATTATSLKEGTDYSFTAHVDGHPVRWSCEKPTTIALAGDVPAGTSAALQDAVTELRSVSGLPLELLSPDQNANITVHYAPHGTTLAGAELSDTDRLGVGQIRYDPTTGALTHGLVLIRADTPHTDPTIPTGKAVLTHELLHTLGIGHAHQGTDEIMTPTVVPGRPPTLGAGDHAALRGIGCPR